jgi:hypothetical protein
VPDAERVARLDIDVDAVALTDASAEKLPPRLPAPTPLLALSAPDAVTHAVALIVAQIDAEAEMLIVAHPVGDAPALRVAQIVVVLLTLPQPLPVIVTVTLCV